MSSFSWYSYTTNKLQPYHVALRLWRAFKGYIINDAAEAEGNCDADSSLKNLTPGLCSLTSRNYKCHEQRAESAREKGSFGFLAIWMPVVDINGHIVEWFSDFLGRSNSLIKTSLLFLPLCLFTSVVS